MPVFCHHTATVIGRGPIRVGISALLLFVCAATAVLAVPAAGQGSRRWSWRLLQEWLKTEHEKVVKDADRIVVLARNLRHELEEKREISGSQGYAERAQELESIAKRLQEAAGDADEKILSVPLVNLAEDVRGRARSLRRSFEEHPARRKLDRFRLFCQEIEERADAVRRRASSP